MALWLRDIPLEWGESEALLPVRIARLLGVAPQEVSQVRVLRRAIDARRKPHLRRVYTVEFSVSGEARLLQRHAANPHLQAATPAESLPVRCLAAPYRVLVLCISASINAAKAVRAERKAEFLKRSITNRGACRIMSSRVLSGRCCPDGRRRPPARPRASPAPGTV